MSSRSQRALFNMPSSPPIGDENVLLDGMKRNIHSTPKHGETVELDNFEFSAIYPGESSIVSSKNTNNRKDVIQITRNRLIVYFGFVTVGEAYHFEYKFMNPSNEQLRFKVHLDSSKSVKDVFKVLNNELIVQPKEEGVISLTFQPATDERFYETRLFLERQNGLYRKFTVKVFGFGGRANVGVSHQHIEDGTMLYSHSGKIIFMPDFYPPPPSIVYPSCFMTLVNKGDRSAFVCIQAVDKKGQQDEQIRIVPNRCVIGTKTGQKYKKFKITVKRDHSGQASTTAFNSSVKLRVLWGEELQRIRFKIWQSKTAYKMLIYGENFMEPYEGEATGLTSLPQLEPLDHECDEFKNSMRIMEVNVVDNRLMSHYNI